MFARRLIAPLVLSCLTASAFLAVSGPALAEAGGSGSSPDLIPPASAQAVLATGKHRVSYMAGWSEIGISGPDGEPQGTVSAISYVRIPPDASRPVIFAFNGGPGASSADLNFGFMGPKRWAGNADVENRSSLASSGRKLVDNEQTLLKFADLVLIDTPGSGFSHALTPGGLSYFWTAPHDAQAVETFIRQWLIDNKRIDAPIYLMGESYGGYRICVMSPRVADLNIAGVIMISPALDLTDQPGTLDIPDAHFVYSFPTLAVAAWHHGRVAARLGSTAEQVFDAAAQFAQTQLLVALERGTQLATPERDRIASLMSAFVGLPPESIARANLRIDPQVFLETLIPDRTVGRLDTRVTGPAHRDALIDGRSKSADDPALGIGASNIAFDPVVGAYLRSIGVRTTAPYVSINLEMNLNLDWAYGTKQFEDEIRLNPTPLLQEFFRRRDNAKLLLIGGYYDLTVPILSAQHALTHTSLPSAKVRMVAFEGPHAVYSDDRARSAVINEIAGFIGGTKLADSPRNK